MFSLRILLALGCMLNTVLPVSASDRELVPTGSFGPVPYQQEERSSRDSLCEAVLWRGIDAMYSYRFREAEAILDSAMALDPYNSVAPLVAVGNQWQLTLTEEGYEASHEAMLQAIDAAIPRYEDMISHNGRQADILLYLGSAYGLRTRSYLAEKNWLAGLYSGLKGWGLVRQAYALDSTLTDAYLPIGIFDFYAAMHSAPVQLAARLFGINPDRSLGIALLKRAANEAPYAWIEAASVLAQIYLYIEGNPEAALQYTDVLLNHYPNNYDFSFMMGEELVWSRKLPEAREFMIRLEILIEQSHPNRRREWELKYATLQAALAFEEGDRDRALEHCRWVIEHYDMEFDWHLGFAHYIRGQVRELRADMAGAREDYRIVAGLGNRTYVVEEAQVALDRVDRIMSGR